MRNAFFFLLKSLLIFSLLLSIFFHAGAQEKNIRTKIHQISLDYSQDFILRQYNFSSGSPHSNIHIYEYVLGYCGMNIYSFSLGVKYKYYNERCFFFKCGLYYRNQVSLASTRDINYNGEIKFSEGDNKAWLSYFDIPVGFGFSFFNKRIVRPYIEVGLSNSFLFYEKINCRFPSGGSYDQVSLSTNQVKYYNFKGSLNAGCEFHIHKKYVIGLDFSWRTKPLIQNQKTLIYTFSYSNYGFGINFGYVIK